MPYSDPEKQREAQRRWYMERYRTDKKFRRLESKRKAGWLQSAEGKASNAQASARYREKMKKLKAKKEREKVAAKKAKAKPAKAAKPSKVKSKARK